ncbi:MAG: hypothetical protein AB7V77_02690 [Candidatus Woesearchaeota archaeon]
MINDIVDELLIENKKVTQAHVRRKYFSRIIHIGIYGDELCPNCISDKEKINEFMKKYGEKNTYYALIDNENSGFILVNLNGEEPISEAYKF